MKVARSALDFFLPGRRVSELMPVAGGNVNESFRVLLASGRRYILQKLSPAVFARPEHVIANLSTLTDYLDRAGRKQRPCSIRFPHLIRSPDGETAFVDLIGNYWRLLTWIENTRTMSAIKSGEQGRAIGRLLGCFHRVLRELPPGELYDPLPGFHHTPTCLHQYDQVAGLRPDSASPDEREQQCIFFIDKFRDRTGILEEHRPSLSSSIIHGDPKVGNFLFDAGGEQAVSLIDLDTLMPGLLLHDLGDCLRSCCNPAGEEVDYPQSVVFDRHLFAAVMAGYCEQAFDLLGETDRALLIDAVFLISYELGIRFFTDYLAGNVYFKVKWPEQNLQRALVQFYLAASIDNQRRVLDLLWQQGIMAADTQDR
ncbi:MAG TPA: aminoglycoside phosphotransferase family protein [Desulfobulbus sp.]|nr:aminoglycoside phosphotransferase family protein [Desulfobulbus sp.]